MTSDTGLRVVTKAEVIVITSLLGGIKGVLSFPPTATTNNPQVYAHEFLFLASTKVLAYIDPT